MSAVKLEFNKMNIEKLIKRDAYRDDEHDKAYAKALRSIYELIKNNSKDELLFYQKFARDAYAKGGNTHNNTARCVITYELLKQDHGTDT
jgi:hypothetical protein